MSDQEKTVDVKISEILELQKEMVVLMSLERKENIEKQRTFRVVAISLIGALAIIIAVGLYGFLENAFVDQTTVDVKVDNKDKIQKEVTEPWLEKQQK